MALPTQGFLSFCDGFVITLGQVSLAQGNSLTSIAKEISWILFFKYREFSYERNRGSGRYRGEGGNQVF